MRPWRALALAGLAALAIRAGAEGSHERWAFGAQGCATVPYFELDPEYQVSTGTGGGATGPRHRLQAGAGLADWFELGLGWEAGEGDWAWTPWAKARALSEDRVGLDAALLAGGSAGPVGFNRGEAGAALGRTLWDQELAANALWLGAGDFEARAGWRSPYVVYALRLGVEARAALGRGADLNAAWGPQLFINLPGDLCLRAAGLRQGDGWRFLAGIGFELFPNP